MAFSMKEQLIILLMNRASYDLLYAYVKFCYQHQLMAQSASIQEMNLRLKVIAERSQRSLSVTIDDEQLTLVQQLAQQSMMIGDKVYPKLWHHIHKPPLIIFYKGQLASLQKPLISIVGSRKITAYGEQMTQLLVQACAQKGWGVVSGLARGIDSVVHQTAIANHQQSTIAIIASGLHRVYPKEHDDLQQKLGQQHLVLSEYLPDMPPLKHHFIMRNRLVAGLTPVTLVIEAAKQSGSLITANYALQFNREVFALPGKITDQQSVGCNELIASGATPILSIEDTIEQLTELFARQQYLVAQRNISID